MRQSSIIGHLTALLLLTVCFVSTANAETVKDVSSDSENSIYFEEDHLTLDAPHGYSIVYGTEVANDLAYRIGYINADKTLKGVIVPAGKEQWNAGVNAFLTGTLTKVQDRHVNSLSVHTDEEWTDRLGKMLNNSYKSLTDGYKQYRFELIESPREYDNSNALTVSIKIREKAWSSTDSTEDKELTDEDDMNCLCATFVFFAGKESWWMWKIDYLYRDRKKAAELAQELANSLHFDSGFSHSDFVYEKRTNSTTNDFLSAISNKNNIDYPMAEEVKEKSAKPNILAEGAEAGRESINKAGVKEIATVIGIILALLLLIAAGLQGYILFCKPKTGTLTDGTQSGRFGSRILVARLGIFLVSYSGAIVLSAALIFAMAYLSLFLIVAIINGWFVLLFAGNVLSIFIDAVVFTTLAALWMMSIIICRILTEPMIRILGKYPKSGIRITREDAPELYDMILATADECGVEHPTHIYISGKVNASVSYVKPIKSIFKPGDMKLTIGFPLFMLLSVQELKAVLAHEFGHISQKETRITNAAGNAGFMISKLFSGELTSYRKLNEWCMSDNRRWRKWGERTRTLVRSINGMMYNLFVYITGADNELRRNLELDADRMSAQCAGSLHAVSANHKIGLLNEIYYNLSDLVNNFMNKKDSYPYSITEAMMELVPYLQCRHDREIKYSDVLDQPVTKSLKSKIEPDETWQSHPDDEIRINVMRELNVTVANCDTRAATELLSPKLISMFDQMVRDNTNETLNAVPTDQFIEWAKGDFKDRSFPENLTSFFKRYITLPPEKLLSGAAQPEELTEEMLGEFAEQCDEYLRLWEDVRTLTDFRNSKGGRKYIVYDGVRYTRRTLPFDAIRAEFDNMYEQIMEIDTRIYAHALYVAGDRAGMIRKAYDDVLYGQHMDNSFEKEFRSGIEWLNNFYSTPNVVTSEQAAQIIRTIEDMEAALKRMFHEEVDVERLAPVAHEESIEWINQYMAKPVSLVTLDDVEYIRDILAFYGMVTTLLIDMIYYSKKLVASVLEGTSPTLYWDNSVAAARIAKQEAVGDLHP